MILFIFFYVVVFWSNCQCVCGGGVWYKLNIAVGAFIRREAFFRGVQIWSIRSFTVTVSFATEVDRRSIKTCLAQNFNLPIFFSEILVCLLFSKPLGINYLSTKELQRLKVIIIQLGYVVNVPVFILDSFKRWKHCKLLSTSRSFLTKASRLFKSWWGENSSLWKVHNLSCENGFYLHENEKSFPYQRLSI